MIDRLSGEDAPELANSEQDDESEQTHTVADEALEGEGRAASPLDSEKSGTDSDLMDDSTQDLVDHMRDMEQSGRIDMDAFRGEDNHDDNEDKYGRDNKVDPELPSDGS
ncbi:hypothetical protein [Croceibacterium ferulae]|uniref:hypothetical protein n=1 Tax=Croceibacterium ferulae TaxID=1854641 RepID=UPI000EB1E71B|nr:hypothetical protein [Croceibacterium ferulae]